MFSTEESQDTALNSIFQKATKEQRTGIRNFFRKFILWIKEKLGKTSYTEQLQMLEDKWINLIKNSEATEETGAVKYEITPDNDILEENISKGKRAINDLIKKSEDSINPEKLIIKNAMYRSGIGYIDFVWRKPGSGEKFKKGYGLSHIIAKHGEDAPKHAIEVIAKSTEYDKQGNNYTNESEYRLRMYYEGYTVILNKSPNKNHWLLTSWDNKEEAVVSATGEVRDSHGATAVTPTLNRRNRVNTTASNGSISNNPENVKKKNSISPENIRYNQERYVNWLLNTQYKLNVKEDAVNKFAKELKHISALDNGTAKQKAEARELLDELSKKMADEYNIPLIPEAQELLRYIRNTKFSLTETQKQEAMDKYGSVTNIIFISINQVV